DSVYLSADGVYDTADTLLGSFSQTSTLQPGASYTAHHTLTLPNGIAGSYYVLVRADAGNAVFESTDEANNTGRSIDPVAVTLKASPDLSVSQVSGPATGQAGQTASVNFTVTNSGNGAAQGSWTDFVYLSPSGTLSGASLLAQIAHTGDVAGAGGTYSVTQNVTLPFVADGNYRFLVATDATHAIYEHNAEADNLTASAAQV